MLISPFNCIIMFFAYIVGSIPSGFIIARLKGIHDIRDHGSGNIGASNVGRFIGKRYFFVVLACDAFKAYIFLSILRYFSVQQSLLLLSSASLLIGNAYSIFLRGNGGKGVATLFGIVCALSNLLACGIFVVWTVVAFFTGTAALASLASVIALSVGAWFLSTQLFFSSFCATMFIFWRHRKNIYSFF